MCVYHLLTIGQNDLILLLTLGIEHKQLINWIKYGKILLEMYISGVKLCVQLNEIGALFKPYIKAE